MGGLLASLAAGLAAGAFLVFLRPFKAGDFIEAGGVVGTVQEIGLFVTTVNTPDNVRTYVGNNKLFSGNIQNFTGNPFRRGSQIPAEPRGGPCRSRKSAQGKSS